MTPDPLTLVEVLRDRAGQSPSRIAFRFPGGRGRAESTLDHRQLHDRAAALAGGLLARVRPGDRVLLALAEPAQFVPALLACLYAGVVAVPTPLGDATVSVVAANQTEGIARDALPSLGITSSQALLDGRTPEHPALAALPWVRLDELDGDPVPPRPADGPAVLQYTSGSTSAPKGVEVTHANIVDQAARLRDAFHLGRDSVLPSWLPLYHDMGLVATVLTPVFAGCEAVLVAPREFIRDPLLWLRMITRYRGTVCGAPNFAYDLCARRATPEAVAELDLRSWRVAWNGAEPILADTLARFTSAFEPAGFQRAAFYPCFGMAETTLMVAGGQDPLVREFSRSGLESGVATEADGEERAATLVGSGTAAHGQRIAIVDTDRRIECSPGTVGEVWVSGPSVAAGYWGRPELSEQTFLARLDGADTGYLRTGDAGFVVDGELFISGRLKDLIILRGRNIFPQDLELSAERCDPALRQGRGAAFAIPTDAGTEEVVVVQEVRDEIDDPAATARRIRDAVATDHGLVPAAVVLIPSGALPKTSSGKVRRSACRASYLDGTLPVLVEDRIRVSQ